MVDTVRSPAELENLQIIKQGVVPYSFSGGNSAVTTIPHNLGYTPMMLVFLQSGATTDGNTVLTPLPTTLGGGVSGGALAFSLMISASADNTNLFINALYTTGTTLISGYYIRYILFRQDAK